MTSTLLPLSRREFLWRSGGGLGGLALAHLLGSEGLLADASLSSAKQAARLISHAPVLRATAA